MMLLPEMTSSARVARAFQRFARGAVVGLALGGLAACGGGWVLQTQDPGDDHHAPCADR